MDTEIQANQLLLEALDLLEADEAKARALFLQAAEMGNAGAMHFAYHMLSQGQGGPFDRAKAFEYLVRSAELGQVESIYSLGFCYLNGGMGNGGYSDEVLAQKRISADIPKALELLTRAAQEGHGLAALRIAEHFEGEADNDPLLLQKAIDWYERGAVLGEPNCLIHLADMLVLGRGLSKDHKHAKKLYRQAAKSDDICAKNAGKQRLKDFDSLESILGN